MLVSTQNVSEENLKMISVFLPVIYILVSFYEKGSAACIINILRSQMTMVNDDHK
jgi:hypothetical protein